MAPTAPFAPFARWFPSSPSFSSTLTSTTIRPMSVRTSRPLARVEGLMVGISAAANVAAALRVARQLEQGVVVTILCDGASKYLSDRFWDEEALCQDGEGI